MEESLENLWLKTEQNNCLSDIDSFQPQSVFIKMENLDPEDGISYPFIKAEPTDEFVGEPSFSICSFNLESRGIEINETTKCSNQLDVRLSESFDISVEKTEQKLNESIKKENSCIVPVVNSNIKQENDEPCHSGQCKSNQKQEKIFTCKICYRKFNRKFCLQCHLLVHSKILTEKEKDRFIKKEQIFISTGENSKIKHEFSELIKSDQSFVQTMPAQIKIYTCNKCEKTFTSKFAFQRHSYIHSNASDGLFSCTKCRRSFKFNYHLNIHVCRKPDNNELIEKPICHICGKIFTSSCGLKMHLGIHSNENKHKCDMCDKSFTQKGDLKRHKSVHSGEKPYECDQCYMKFRCKYFLKRHKIVHTDEKSFKCTFCEMKFRNKQSLDKHIRVHTGEKPFHCDVCNKSFTQKIYLRNHKTVFHKN